MRDWLGEAKAKQVYLVLRDRILGSAWGFGARLPTENELAELHGAALSIESKPGEGTSVTIRFPDACILQPFKERARAS